MTNKFEDTLLNSGEFMRRGGMLLINNAGRAVAVITLLVAALVTFTDLSFGGFGAKNFTATVLVMLFSSYLIYFSMEDAGEKTGEESEEYKTALLSYDKLRASVGADRIEELRDFCNDYSRAELSFRQKSLLLSYGEGTDAFEEYLAGKRDFEKRRIRLFRRAERLRAVPISPKILLSRERGKSRSELSNPDSFKLLRLALKLIPTTLGMLLTVSIIPSVKENMSASAVIEGILKLSSLPIIALRGYSAGYFHVKRSSTLWLETKTRLLEAFLKSRKEEKREAV